MSPDVRSPSPRAGSPLLHGRRRELEILHDLLRRLQEGYGAVVLISGEAGIGKTSLVEALTAEAADAGVPVLSAISYDLELSTPYSLWHEVFRSAEQYSDLPLPPPSLKRSDTFESVSSAREFWDLTAGKLIAMARHKPILLVLEDLHWADQSSVELLRHLTRQLAHAPVLIVVTYRDIDLTPAYPLYHLLPHLVRENRPARLPLRPLALEALRALVRSRFLSLKPEETDRLASYLDQYAEGNPLFIEELIALLEEDRVLWLDGDGWHLRELPAFAVPPLIRQIIEGRLERLSPEAMRALQVAAVFGMEVPFDLWQSISAEPGDLNSSALEEVLQTRVLEETIKLDVVRFRHALVRDAIYWNINMLHRRRWHAQIAEALADRSEVEPGSVAHHFVQADDERAADWLIEAAQQAARAFAMHSAVTGYERALTILQQNPARLSDQAGVLCALAEANRFTDTRQALGYISQAVSIAERIDDPGANVLSRWVHARIRGFDDQNVLDDLIAAAAAYRELPTEEQLRISRSPLGYVVSDATLSQDLANYGQFEAALEHAQRFFREHAAPVYRAQYIEFGNAHFGLGIACAALGDAERARTAFEKSRSYFRESGSFQMVSNCYYWELNTVAMVYYPDQPSERHRLQWEEVQANLSSEFVDAQTGERQGSTSETLIFDGDWDACWRSASARLSIPASRVPSARKLAEIEWLRGNVERAWHHIQRVLPAGPDEPPGRRFFLHRQELQLIAAEMALDGKDLELARRWIEAFERWQEWSGKVTGSGTSHLLRAHFQAQQGNLDDATKHAQRALELATEPSQPLARLRALRTLGTLFARAANQEEGQRHISEALRIAQACAAPYELARTQVTQAEILKKESASDEVRELLAGAREAAERLEAQPLLDRIDNMERESSQEQPGPAALPGGLSPREAEVLQLLARGMTDAEIADALFISTRTVHGHLNSIYSKFEVRSRTAAVARAFAEGIVKA